MPFFAYQGSDPAFADENQALPQSVASASVGDGATVGLSGTNAYGDFNGDGIDDLAIGAKSEDVGSISDAGSVNVLYGSNKGLQTSAPADQFWTQNSPGVDNSANEGDFFGYSLASGDFDGDGHDDLAIGVAFEDIGSASDAGAVNVLYGSSSGLRTSAAGDGSGRTDQFWHQGKPGVEDAEASSDVFGYSLTAGDFNGDGKDDLAIGVPGEDANGIAEGGAVNVLYGSSSGLQTSSPADQFWSQDSPGVEGETESDPDWGGDVFGFSLASADFNHDGRDDLAIGVPGDNTQAGAVNLLYGSSSGLQTSSPADQLWSQDSPDVEDVAEESNIDLDGDQFGTSITTGDFNGDMFADLAIGVPEEGFGFPAGAGAVNVLYGSSSGLQTSSPADQFWSQDSPGVENNGENFDLFGSYLASGDFNGDGYIDLAIGVPAEDIGTVFQSGAVNVIYGSSSGLRTSAAGDGSGRTDQFWHQGKPGVEDAEEPFDFFGTTLASGDFNGDGKGDLAIGVRSEDIGSVIDAGAVQILYGSSSGLQTSSPADQFWTQNSPGVDDTVEAGDGFGSL